MSSTSARIAVVLLNWNGRSFIERFLPGICQYNRPDSEIWIADNASTDDSLSWVERHFPQVRILRIPQNLGFAAGYNYALERIEAEYVVLLNQDVEVTPHWLDPLLQRMEAETGVGAVQPKLRAFHQRDHFEYAGAAGGMLDYLGYPFCRGRLFEHLEPDHGQYDSAMEVAWASGAALFVRRELYLALGGLDEAFFAHMEEIDLCWRIRRAGYRVYCEPASVVYHVGGGSLERENPKKLYLNFRNNGRMLVKNLPGSRLLWLLPLRAVLDTLAALHEIFIGKPAMASAALRGSWHTLRHLGHWRRQARESSVRIAASRIGPDRTRESGWYRRSIVWQVFALRRRRWSELPG